MVVKLVILVAAVWLMTASFVQAGNEFVVSARVPRGDQRIGPYSVTSARNAGKGYTAAVGAFGQPSSRRPKGTGESRLCDLRWAGLGLEMTFESSAPDPCAGASLATGVWSGATAYGARWRTDKGLRVGDSVAKLHRLYPAALSRAQSQAWALVLVRGEVGVTVFLQAVIRAGRVTALDLPPGFLSAGR